MRRLGTLAFTAVLALGLGASPAYAGRGGGNGGGDRECGRNGGCNNERDENYSGAGCKYICPTFDKSPVQDSFNFDPQVCLPGATCYFEDRKKSQPPAEGQK